MNVRFNAAGLAVLAAAVCVTGAAARTSRQSDVAYATAQVNAALNVPAFTAPGPAFDASKARGKSIFVVPASSRGVADLPSMSAFTGGIRQAGAAAGVKVTVCSNNGTTKAQSGCLAKAVSSKANLVVLVGSTDLTGLATPLAALKQAKIPVLASHVLAPGDFASGVDAGYSSALAGLTATVPAPYAQAAKLMADYVISAANGANTNIALVGSSDLPESSPMLAAVQSEFTTQCGSSCSVTSIDVPYSKWPTSAYSAVKTATLARNTTYLLPMVDQFDDLAAEGEADARQSLATVTRPNICSFGGAPFAIQMGQAANRVVCDIAENMNWDGWATVDQALRVLTGTSPVKSENLPLRLWTAANWFTEGGLNGQTFPPTIDAGWGDPGQYVNGYRGLWGLPTLAATSYRVNAPKLAAASNLPVAQANAAKYDSAPAFDEPGPDVDAAKAKGKRIFVIPALPDASVLPSVNAMIGGIRQAAAAAGVKTASCVNGGSTAAWTKCFREATALKVNLIVLAGGLEPAAVKPQVAAAAQAGISVVASHVPNPKDFTGSVASTYANAEAGLTAIVPAPYAEIGKLLADEVVVDRPTPAGRFLIIGSSDLTANAGLLATVQAELAAVCGGDCPVETADVPHSQWATQGVATGQSASLAKPTITFIPLFDKLSGYLAEGVHDARVTNPAATQPRIHSYGGTPFVIQMGQDNNRVEGDVAENMNWLGWATVDQVLRVLTGAKPVADENIGLRFVDDDAWGTEGLGPEGYSFPPVLDEGWGDPRGDDGWITGYRGLWGLPAKSDGYKLLGGGGGGDDD